LQSYFFFHDGEQREQRNFDAIETTKLKASLADRRMFWNMDEKVLGNVYE